MIITKLTAKDVNTALLSFKVPNTIVVTEPLTATKLNIALNSISEEPVYITEVSLEEINASLLDITNTI